MTPEKPVNDVADQLRPARPDLEPDDTGSDGVPFDQEVVVDGDSADVIEADPADVADQRRVVPLPDDQP